jgi:predicted NBD/HSP70 family sugar kinase
VRVENDAVAALEAERRWGALQGYDTAPTSPGAPASAWACAWTAACCAARTATPATAATCSCSDNDDALCGCGNIGDLEALVAGNAVARRFGADAATLMQRASAGDAAVRTVDELCRVMGRALYNITVILDLQRISLGGSVFLNNQDYLLPRLQAQLRASCRRSPTAASWCRRAWRARRRLRGARAAGLKRCGRRPARARLLDALADLLALRALVARLRRHGGRVHRARRVQRGQQPVRCG